MSGLFNLPPRATKAGDSSLAKKAKSKAKPNAGITIKGGGGLLERISTITAMVNKYLGKYKEKYEVINTAEELKLYIDDAIKNGIISIDSETNSLDPITCTLAGLCLYTPGRKAVYVPLHHISYITGVEVEDLIADEVATEQLNRLIEHDVKVIMFNAKFDCRVIKNQLNVALKPHWDCYIAARLLNENEPENNLKALHKKYCMNGEGDAFTFDNLFKGIPFTHIPIKTGYLYAARDAEITYEYYLFQLPFLTIDGPTCIEKDLQGVAKLFHEIEMPLIPVVAEMEDTGVAFDFKYAEELSVKYTKILKEREANFYKALDMYSKEIDEYKLKNPGHKLGDPINVGSPTQLAILFYDILKLESVDKKKPRGTGEEIIDALVAALDKKQKRGKDNLLAHNQTLLKSIIDYRETAKLISTYIDKMPGICNPKTNRIHASFNQIGADTGRFSSQDPNLQNIPSHNTDIRKMFMATEGYVMVSSDYSAQEPRLTAHMSKDEKMIGAYTAGKDLYVEIASIAYNLPYDECKEFRADGTRNEAGKERRNSAKAIVLGVCYGKGVPAIADDLHLPVAKAQEIYDKIMKSFPGLKQFMVDSETMAAEKGFVTTVWGRKRRLPDMQLPPYEFTYIGGAPKDFDPLFDDEEEAFSFEVDEATAQRYTNMLIGAKYYKQKEKIKEQAKAEGIAIKDNNKKIADATRQCVNSRIQGSAADQTKKAMILVGNDEQLKQLGFRLLIPVHDELIGECPKANAKVAGERLSQLMVIAASELAVPSKCDVETTDRWYGEPIAV